MMSFTAEAQRRRAQLDQLYGPWRPVTLMAALDRAVARYPGRTFVAAGDDEYSYAELRDWAGRLARGLLARGIQPGDRIALFLPNGAEFIAARFAIAQAGAVAVPVSYRLHAAELAQVLAQAEAAALITMEAFREIDALAALDAIIPGWAGGGRRAGAELPALRLVVTVPDGHASGRPGTVTLRDLETGPEPGLDAELARRRAAASPDDIATIFYTSGTSGLPKGVLSSHDMELRSAYGSAWTRAFEDGRRILFALPLNHVFAYVEGLLAAIFAGGTVVVQPVFDPHATLAAIERHRVGEVLFVPTMSLAVIDAARAGGHDLSSLHSVMSAAASAPARLWHDLTALLGVEQLVTAYGMTETSAATTFTEPGGPVADLVETVGRPKGGGVAGDPGLAGRLAEYKTVDPVTGADLPPGAEGELAARGPIVTSGYFRAAEATTAATLPGGWLRSGDLGYVRGDGSLVLTGRARDLYKCGGELVMPAQVEAFLTSRPDIAQAHVVGVPDERMGEVGCAWLVPAQDAVIDPGEVLAHCRAELARFKVPAYALLTTAAELPLTGSGKVQKFRLAQRAVARLGLAGSAGADDDHHPACHLPAS